MVEQTKKISKGDVIKDAVEFCMMNGLAVKSTTKENEYDYIHAPFSLFPTPFPRKLFKDAIAF